LKDSSFIIYLDRKLEDIKKSLADSNNRPLADIIDVAYEQRKPLYEKYANATIKADTSADQVAKSILTLIAIKGIDPRTIKTPTR
ncbi:shikimate kinase, partial [Treponema sp. R6D11]